MKRYVTFLRKLCSGQSILFVREGVEAWNSAFGEGRWNHLMTDHPNTVQISGLVLHLAKERESSVSILDVGCGNGALPHALNKASASFKYTGYDFSETGISQAREAAPWARFFVGSAEHPPLTRQTFDVIIFNEVFFYMDPDRVLKAHVPYTHKDTIIIVSIIRSWRSLLLWRKIRQHLVPLRRFVIKDTERTNTFDIMVGRFVATQI